MKGLVLMLAAAITLVAIPARAQSGDVTARLQEKLRQGDRVKLTLDGGMVTGRVEAVGTDRLTVQTDAGEQAIPFTSVIEARRTRRGMLLGTLIGAGVGAAFGAVAASYAENETGNASTAFLTVMAIGIGAGAGIDALINLERTVYRRRSSARMLISPAITRSGGGVAATVRW
jgi:preprotein translocase subunit YajC